jgi:hypothetical protein
MTTRTYSSAAAFKQALEQRLRSATETGAQFTRKRQILVFDRFLARIVSALGDAATLKGGLVLEIRLEKARTTKDVDLRLMVAEDVLAFAGIAPPTLRLYPLESHIAEKLHAYTMPRNRPNSRVKDLPDLALLSTVRDIEGTALRNAINQTFEYRATHPVPDSFPEPPSSWATVYERMASNDGLQWPTLVEVTSAVRAFLNPVLAGTNARWEPQTWTWRESR